AGTSATSCVPSRPRTSRSATSTPKRSSRFGVKARLSAPEPESLEWDDRHDLVIVPSLFSHLPDRTFARWLGFLHGLLTERGVLGFSVHGEELAGGADLSAGIDFKPYSRDSELDPEEHSSTHVTEEYLPIGSSRPRASAATFASRAGSGTIRTS